MLTAADSPTRGSVAAPNRLRRLLVLVTLVGAIVAGTDAAQASFADSATVTATPMSIATDSVAPVTHLEAKMIVCTSPTSGTMKIEWWRSTSRGVTGYVITAYPASGPAYELIRTGPSDEAFISADPALLASTPRFTVTTLTSYGWTAVSGKTSPVSC
jgi:hypothetical protein